jgi:hypothetical protein
VGGLEDDGSVVKGQDKNVDGNGELEVGKEMKRAKLNMWLEGGREDDGLEG